jgi:hypothetical protein
MGNETPMSQRLRLAAQQQTRLQKHLYELIDYANLRNAIVHGRGTSIEIIAEPTEDTLKRFQILVQELTNPPAAVPRFQRPVQCFSPQDSLTDVLSYMNVNDFSQVVVSDGHLSLVTTEGIAAWVADHVADGIVEIAGVALDTILKCEPPGTCAFARRSASIMDIYDEFSRALSGGRPHLYAVLITETGSSKDKPIGFVTPWDLLGT